MTHNKKDGHVMSMAPENGGTSGAAGPKTPSDGYGYPAIKAPPQNGDGGNGGEEPPKKDCRVEEIAEKPIPVVFTQATFLKLVAAMVLPLIGAVSAFFYFYHKTNVHLEDPNIHLGKAERQGIETKKEARTERKKLRTAIKKHVNLKVREIKVEQKEQLDTAKAELKKQQKIHYNRILSEIRKHN